MGKAFPLGCVPRDAGGSMDLGEAFLPSWQHVSATVLSSSLCRYKDVCSQAVKPWGEILGAKASLIEKVRQLISNFISFIIM